MNTPGKPAVPLSVAAASFPKKPAHLPRAVQTLEKESP